METWTQDEMVRALLALRNTPNPNCKNSPAEIIFNRKLRGFLHLSPNSTAMRWIHGDLKERARRERAVKSVERLSEHSRDLKKLKEGDMDFVQNQTEMEKNWDSHGRLWKRQIWGTSRRYRKSNVPRGTDVSSEPLTQMLSSSTPTRPFPSIATRPPPPTSINPLRRHWPTTRRELKNSWYSSQKKESTNQQQ